MQKAITESSLLYKLATSEMGGLSRWDFKYGHVDTCKLNQAIIKAVTKGFFAIAFILLIAVCTLFPLGHTIAWFIACVVVGTFYDPGPLVGIPAMLIVLAIFASILVMIVHFASKATIASKATLATKLKASDLYKAARDKYCHKVVLISKES